MSAGVAQIRTNEARQRGLQKLGIFCGFAAALWLAGAEAPTKLVSVSVSPLIISFMMVLGAFVSRWSLPALMRGSRDTLTDTRHVPHLVIWGIMAGCLWAVGNTLTIFAVRDIGLSLAFPLWNSNSLIGILWGTLLFKELHGASRLKKLGVIGGAVIIFLGALLISNASTSQSAHGNAIRGILSALGAGLMFGSMYIPYRKAYITGMNPLTFLTYFTIGEMTTVAVVAIVFLGGIEPFWTQLSLNRNILFWPLLGGFMWVVGDLLQNYATKYVGISRAIPLSNTNQLWGLLWAIFVFSELRGLGAGTYTQVIGGSLLMAAGAVSIAYSSANQQEYKCWRDAAEREARLYGISGDYVVARMHGHPIETQRIHRTWFDWLVVAVATAIFAGFGALSRMPRMEMNMTWLAALSLGMLVVIVIAGVALWRTTKFT